MVSEHLSSDMLRVYGVLSLEALGPESWEFVKGIRQPEWWLIPNQAMSGLQAGTVVLWR